MTKIIDTKYAVYATDTSTLYTGYIPVPTLVDRVDNMRDAEKLVEQCTNDCIAAWYVTENTAVQQMHEQLNRQLYIAGLVLLGVMLFCTTFMRTDVDTSQVMVDAFNMLKLAL